MWHAGLCSAPERIRTSDLRFRRPTLYPAELRAQNVESTVGVSRSTGVRAMMVALAERLTDPGPLLPTAAPGPERE
jgi:hypothetical protein